MRRAKKDIFYTYVLFDWRGMPFYVGKGHDNRWLEHEQETDPVNWLKNEIIERTWIVLGEIPKIKVREDLSEAEAFAVEIALIKAIGRRDLGSGPLINLTHGGDGTSGFVYPKYLRQIRATQFKALRAVEGFAVLSARSKQSLAKVRNKLSENTKAQMAALSSEERRARALKANAKLTPEQRRARAILRESRMTPEQRRDRSLRAAATKTPEERSEIAKRRQRAMSPERRKAIAIKAVTTRKASANPNYKPKRGKTKYCDHCGNEFYVKTSWANLQRFCSNHCRIAAMKAAAIRKKMHVQFRRLSARP